MVEKRIKILAILLFVTLVFSSCAGANPNERILRKAFGIGHADEAKVIANAINKANLGDIEEIEKDKSSSEIKYIIYTEDNNEYTLYLSSSYRMQALINNKTKEAVYATIQ